MLKPFLGEFPHRLQHDQTRACSRITALKQAIDDEGAEGIQRYTDPQAVAVQRLFRFSPVLGMSDETFGKAMTAQLRLMRRTRRP